MNNCIYDSPKKCTDQELKACGLCKSCFWYVSRINLTKSPKDSGSDKYGKKRQTK
jgi:hypothetical protein